MRAYTDNTRCILCGICGGACPEIFIIGSEGKSIALDIELTGELLTKAKLAEALCPVLAIKITNSDDK